MGCHGVRWQGATTLWAYAHEEKQRGQRASGRLNRVCSVLTSLVILAGGNIFNSHTELPRCQVAPTGLLQLPLAGPHPMRLIT